MMDGWMEGGAKRVLTEDILWVCVGASWLYHYRTSQVSVLLDTVCVCAELFEEEWRS